MKRLFVHLSFVLLVFMSCKNESNSKKNSILSPELDSIEKVNTQSIIDSGDKVTKAYVNSENNQIDLWADIRMDHRFYGYEKPDTNSKRLILFSIFTNDVDGNPFDLPLGSFYSTADVEGGIFTYIKEDNGFVEAEFTNDQGQKTTLFFEIKWIVLESDPIETDDDYNPEVSDDSIRSYGLVEKYQDGAYPMYIVTIDFVEKNYKQDFDLNIEAVSIDATTLNTLVGKYVSFYYTSDWVEDINDLYVDGKSLSGEYAPELDSEWSTFTGTLSGAESLSGDLPSVITITNSAGKSMDFEWFVDDVVLKANTKEVTAYYSGRAINTIVDINPSLD